MKPSIGKEELPKSIGFQAISCHSLMSGMVLKALSDFHAEL